MKKIRNRRYSHTVSNDFAIIGKLYGVDFKVVTNMRKQKYWIFQDQIIKAILQTSGTRNSFGKNYHLLLHPEISHGNLLTGSKYLACSVFKSNYSS